MKKAKNKAVLTTNPKEFEDKHVRQVIAIAGSGKLTDGSNASLEFRQFLGLVPSSALCRYAEECLSGKFEGSGLALQDIINQVGRRLGFQVTDGKYRGSPGKKDGHDGLWRSVDDKYIVVEVKTTDAYSIDLDKIAEYRKNLIREDKQITEWNSSILIIVGRKDTGGLESQTRGSRHAWDVRLISVDALLRLMTLKEELEDPLIIKKICEILTPQEYTRVDAIIDIVFATAVDVQQDSEMPDEDSGTKKARSTPVRFHEDCMEHIRDRLGISLLRESRATFRSPDGKVKVVCVVSKEFLQGGRQWYWFAFHPYQKDGLEKTEKSYVAYGCGSGKKTVLIPYKEFAKWLEGLNKTEMTDRFYWHVQIYDDGGKLILKHKTGFKDIDITQYLV